MRRASGQSLVEFAAGAAAMSLLLLGTVLLANYQEVDRRGLFAARQQAYAGAWLAGRATPAAQARVLYAAQLADPGVSAPFDGRQYVPVDGITLDAGETGAAGAAATAANAMLQPLRAAGGFFNTAFDLANDGLVKGEVRAHLPPPAGAPAPFADLDLALVAPYALLGDAWHAGDARHVVNRTGGLVPASALAGLARIWQPLMAPLSLLEPSLGELCLGIVEAERIPEDRLGAGTTPLPRRCP
jgi:hypothetical protein